MGREDQSQHLRETEAAAHSSPWLTGLRMSWVDLLMAPGDPGERNPRAVTATGQQ
jgi:hypothetical protein